MKMANPLTGSTAARKRRNRAPSMQSNGDTTIIRYKAVGGNVPVRSTAGAVAKRWWIGGFPNDLASTAGPDVTSYYSTSVVKPGTHFRWEPSTSPTAGGRGFVGFTDNPEIMVNLYNALEAYEITPNGATYAAYSNLVKGLSSTISWPMWSEYEFETPTKLRRKRFDCNSSVAVNNVNDMDRSCQVAMFACFDGFFGISTDSVIGSFWFRDVIEVEGLNGTAT